MKFRIGEGSMARRIPFSLPRRKRNPNNGDRELGSNRNSLGSDAGFRSVDSAGSKDDAFFESRPWLDSDCEDDFFSVNGDFTPSRGSTPNRHLATPRRSQAHKSSPLGGFTPKSQPESSPNHEKQKLSELLRENQEGDEDASAAKNAANGPTTGSSGASRSDASPNAEARRRREREFKSMQCCLPNFARSLSCRERREPKASPAQ